MPALLSHAVRAVAAIVVVAATAVLSPLSAPAQAAGCASGGVSVVVDPGHLGGGITTSCAPHGGSQIASTVVGSAGVGLTYVTRQPGFVCRVNGEPASFPCVNTPPDDAYWGLFWTDGKSGEWIYSTLGIGSLRVPDGGSIALAWQSGGRRTPGVAAPVAPSQPKPSASSKPTRSPKPKPSTPATKATNSASAKPSAASEPTPLSAASSKPNASAKTKNKAKNKNKSAGKASASPSASVTATPTPAESDSPSDQPSEWTATSDPPAAAGAAIPGWAVGLVGLGFAIAIGGGILSARRSR